MEANEQRGRRAVPVLQTEPGCQRMNQTGVCQTVNEEKSVDDAPKAQQTLFFFFPVS